MYEIFEKLCNKYGITPYRFCKETGVRTSTVSTWKKKNSLVGPELARKICDYFAISMDYLMTGKEETEIKGSSLMPKEDLDLAKKLDSIIYDISNMDENPFYYNGRKIDDKSLAILEQALVSAMKQVEIMQEKDKNK